VPRAAAGEPASAAATITINQSGATVCSGPALQAGVASHRRRVTDLEVLRAKVAGYRRERRRIVFTNGRF
jgi:bifunctional ADP-heptose synthase (sugar kinase/adenylyltransferase)